MIPVLLGVTFIIFVMLAIAPGDPARQVLGEYASQEQIAAKQVELGLNDPLPLRYGRYIFNLVTRGDMGISYATGKRVTTAIFERFPTTMLLAFLGTAMMVIVGLPAGILSAIKQYTWTDNIVRVVAMIGVSMPNFWTGLMLIILFALKLRWLPASGFYKPIYWILPSFVIGFNVAAILMRMTRSSMLECIRQDYIRTARAKGQNEYTITMHHVLRNAMIPVVTVIGNQIGYLLGGAMITEQIFSIPGLGRFMVDAIKGRDYPIVMGGVILIATCYSLVNLIVDIIYAYLDPRIKAKYSSGPRRRLAKLPVGAENRPA
jgi:peptide/nickel transport system permease protein